MADALTHRLALGTAQLGMRYGIANREGQPDPAAASGIVATALAQGIRFFDTAQAYGTSERTLGGALNELRQGGEACVVSKLGPTVRTSDEAAVREAVRGSLERLRRACLWALLLHREEQMDDWPHGLGRALQHLRGEGVVSRLGVSCYSAERAAQALAMPEMDAVQVPGSVFDRRALKAGVLAAARDSGKTVFVRSVYLQGLALMDPGRLPARMSFASPAVSALDGFCRRHGLDRRTFCLGYARDRFPHAVLVVGAETPGQVTANCEALRDRRTDAAWYDEWDAEWPESDPRLVNPAAWPA